MTENERYKAAVRGFYGMYRRLQREHRLRMRSEFDMKGNNSIEIWKYGDDAKGSCICRAREESELACYERAMELLEGYGGKEKRRDEKRAG